MSYAAIDADGVIAMAAATLAASEKVASKGGAAQDEMDAVDHLVPGAPRAGGRSQQVAGDLAELSGWSRGIAIKYVDDEKPLRELATLGYWLPNPSKLGWDPDKTAGENIEKTLRSDEFGALPLGLAGELLNRYRSWQLHVPRSGLPPSSPSLRLPSPDDFHNGQPLVRRASGLYVPQGGSADPHLRRIAGQADAPEWARRTTRSLASDTTIGRPPAWARRTGRGLFVVGAGLSIWDSAASQWEHDQKYHPEYSTTQRVASTGLNVVTEGGGAIAGGYYGATIGATIGTAIFPGAGTIVGGIVGGVIGGFVGSKVGKAVGTGIREAGEAVVDGAKDVWDSIF